MTDGEKCEGCNQRHDCREIYGKLGASSGPSVTVRVLIAFLSPILVFIAFLFVFETAAGFFTGRAELRTAVGLFAAIGGTFLWILVARRIAWRLSRH